MRKVALLAAVVVAAGLSGMGCTDAAAQTMETDVTVRALSQGAKFIGTSVGGARITILDAETGEVLDQGKTVGGTGSTERIMRTKHGRDRVLSTEDAAKYTTSLWLEEPRTVKIRAFGPLNHTDDANTAAVTQKILPGKDLTGGDAVRVTIRGFVVDVLQPERYEAQGNTVSMDVKARVTMMCGCPIIPDGLWDANDYQIRLKVRRDGEQVDEFPMEYADRASHFVRRVTLKQAGRYHLMVYAHDPANGNTGYEIVSYEMDPAKRGRITAAETQPRSPAD